MEGDGLVVAPPGADPNWEDKDGPASRSCMQSRARIVSDGIYDEFSIKRTPSSNKRGASMMPRWHQAVLPKGDQSASRTIDLVFTCTMS